MSVRKLIRKLVYKNCSDSESYVRYLRSRGAKIGERVTIYDSHLKNIDSSRGFLIEIGNDVVLTRGVTILTHGYDWSVLSGVYNDVLGSAGKVTIGNNVFVGMHTTILKGVTIGNNVIIGANSLVNHDIPDNVVAAGNPARVIMSVDEYHEKRIRAQKKEAAELYRTYVERFGKEPTEDYFDEFFWLFADRSKELPEYFSRQMTWHDTYDIMLDTFRKSTPAYGSYDEFLKGIREEV